MRNFTPIFNNTVQQHQPGNTRNWANHVSFNFNATSEKNRVTNHHVFIGLLYYISITIRDRMLFLCVILIFTYFSSISDANIMGSKLHQNMPDASNISLVLAQFWHTLAYVLVWLFYGLSHVPAIWNPSPEWTHIWVAPTLTAYCTKTVARGTPLESIFTSGMYTKD